jgi:phenylalanine ammonia-lyase
MIEPQPLHHARSTYQSWKKARHLNDSNAEIRLDGYQLDVATVVAVARQPRSAQSTVVIDPDPKLRERLELNVAALTNYLEKDWVVYGVNTGFGGSADARTDHLSQLQLSCLQHTQSGIITSWDKGLSVGDVDNSPHVFHTTWVRGAILVRANQNLRGHSAIRVDVLQRLLDLLDKGILPLIPLRGTISASGDLMPLSYIAGVLNGNPDVFVRCRRPGKDEIVTLPAPVALRENGLEPVTLRPKEGLGLINGTAPSTALASLVVFDAQNLAFLSQILTAFTAECLEGNVDWANEFIHRVRPHPGQLEAASNIRALLSGSSFVKGLTEKTRAANGLWQDRYSTRTAPQWMGPYLEDLTLAQRQIETELNSTSDNPLVQTIPGSAVGEVYSGGNFQATAITSAMDKTRMALVMIGRMLFSQCTELINPATNNGLDANLVWGDQDRSFTAKGIDVNMAAYMAELSSLAHPVSSHVQSAEMNNQGINSMAFVSARRTLEAVDIFSHMAAAQIYVCCQAIELRSAHRRFLRSLRQPEQLQAIASSLSLPESATAVMADAIDASWMKENTTPWEERCGKVADSVVAPLVALVCKEEFNEHRVRLLTALPAIQKDVRNMLQRNLAVLGSGNVAKQSNGTAVNGNPLPDSPDLVGEMLGTGTQPVYNFVRHDLCIPPSYGLLDSLRTNEKQAVKTIGSGVSAIYESLRNGDLFERAVMTADLEQSLAPKSNGTGH